MTGEKIDVTGFGICDIIQRHGATGCFVDATISISSDRAVYRQARIAAMKYIRSRASFVTL